LEVKFSASHTSDSGLAARRPGAPDLTEAESFENCVQHLFLPNFLLTRRQPEDNNMVKGKSKAVCFAGGFTF
jgi:hypothetical protein